MARKSRRKSRRRNRRRRGGLTAADSVPHSLLEAWGMAGNTGLPGKKNTRLVKK